MSETSSLLKLRADDAEDLAVISALLQDAVIPVGDIDYLSDRESLVLAANRYRWELADDRDVSGERVLCGLAVANVTSVKTRAIDLKARGEFLNLLSLDYIGVEANQSAVVQLTFSGGAAIRLLVSALTCTMEDFGDTWPTVWQPNHE